LLIESRIWPTKGDEADDAVDAEAEIRAGNAEYLVEQDFELAEGFVAEQSGAAVPAVVTGRQNLGLVRGLERAGGKFCIGMVDPDRVDSFITIFKQKRLSPGI
jgi:hypothetical protein